MALKLTIVLVALLCFLLVHEVQILSGSQAIVSAQKIDCNAKCGYRCSKTYRRKMCMRTCNTCCERCNCVPPGTSGNKEVCPCYANMKTHDGKYKCP